MWLPILLLSLVFMSVGILPPVFIFRNRGEGLERTSQFPIKANSAIRGERGAVQAAHLDQLGTLLQAVFLKCGLLERDARLSSFLEFLLRHVAARKP